MASPLYVACIADVVASRARTPRARGDLQQRLHELARTLNARFKTHIAARCAVTLGEPADGLVEARHVIGLSIRPVVTVTLVRADEQLQSWESREYAAAWAGEDVIADMLDLPRRISVATAADAGIDIAHVVDLGSGPGAFLVPFLRAFPEASATSNSCVMVSIPFREAAVRVGDA